MHSTVTKMVIVGGTEAERKQYPTILKKKYPQNYEFAMTDSGKEAIAYYKALTASCILIDFCIFDMDGLELIKQIVAVNPTKPPAIVILFDAKTRKALIAHALQAGALDALSKTENDPKVIHTFLQAVLLKAETAPAPTTNIPLVAEKKPTETLAVIPTLTAITTVMTAPQAIAKEYIPTNISSQNIFNELIDKALYHAGRYKRYLGLLFLDIALATESNPNWEADNFSSLLELIHKRLSDNLRKSTAMMRIGPVNKAQFCIILDELYDYYDAGIVARRLINQLENIFILNGRQHRATAKIGIVCFPVDVTNNNDLQKRAVDIFNFMPTKTSNSYFYCNETLNTNDLHRVKIINDLQNSLTNNQIYLRYQPIIDLSTHEIISQDTYIQWDHPSLSVIGPQELLSLVDRNKKSIPLCKWTLQQACHDFKEWKIQNKAPERVAIKVSPLQLLDQDFIPALLAIFEETQCAPESIELSLPETLFTDHHHSLQMVLPELHNLGVHLCLKNFGLGHSSLHFLSQHHIDSIKIDPYFIKNCLREHTAAAVIDSIISMGNHLGIDIIANGIETPEQLHFLQDHRCPHGQGMLICQPLKHEEIAGALQLINKPQLIIALPGK